MATGRGCGITWARRGAAILSALACGCGGTLAAGAPAASPASKVELFGHLGQASPSGVASGAVVGGRGPCYLGFKVVKASLPRRARGSHAPCALRFLTQPASAAVGERITSAPYTPSGRPVRVGIVDARGKLVTSSRAPVTVGLAGNPGSATLGGTATVRAVRGVARFDDLTLNQLGHGYRLTASGPKRSRATSRSFDVSSTGTMCGQNESCQTSLATGASNFQVIANADPGVANSGTLSESLNVGTALQCPGYSPEDASSWEFSMSSANRSKTIVEAVKVPLLPLGGSLQAILSQFQMCFGATSDFFSRSGALAPAAMLPDGTSGFIGLLPDCPSSGPCVLSRQGELDLYGGIGFDIAIRVEVPEDLSGDPWSRS